MSTTAAEQKLQVLQSLSFIHNKLLTTHFYPEEFQSADKALKVIAELATALDQQIKSESTPEPATTQEAANE